MCAVRVVNPRPTDEADPSTSNGRRDTWAVEREETAAILGLRPFERFVYVMSVLERYSDQDCSVLLGCARQDVVAAQNRAFQQLETRATLTPMASYPGENQSRAPVLNPCALGEHL
jgi:DNA-directed RNA polymerase specialized sigma24 family protein